MSIARDGWPIAGALLGLAALLALPRWYAASAVVAVLALFTLYFFRDPARTIPDGAGLVISPADGKVVRAQPAGPEGLLGPGGLQVSIFLSIFDVHINRAPISGRVVSVEYRKGEFLPAFEHDASHRNERNEVVLEGDGPVRVGFAQIAGLIARRIVFRPGVDERVERGQRVGLIKFGSRVDVFLPEGSRLRVQVGDRVQGGASILAELP